MFKEEIVGTIEKTHKAYDVCATAKTEFNESTSKLFIDLDRFLRIRDIAQREEPLEAEWLPRKNRVEYSLKRDEIIPTVNEVFHFWSKKVRSSIPHHSFSEEESKT